jgi:hypothetical protein
MVTRTHLMLRYTYIASLAFYVFLVCEQYFYLKEKYILRFYYMYFVIY